MITNDGKEVISKYILGQVPAFATHLSIGCGATPLGTTDPYPTTVHAKKRMDFEMTRVPISSKGFVDNSSTFLVNNKILASNVATLQTTSTHDIIVGESIIVDIGDPVFDGQYDVVSTTANTVSYNRTWTGNVSGIVPAPYGSLIVSRTKISLTAELPTANRYEITEVGIWSAGSNTLAGAYDSRMIFNFSQNWYRHDSSGTISTPSTVTLGTALSSDNINTTETIFYSLSNDILFQNKTRKLRREGPRHLNTTLLMKGNQSTITPKTNGPSWTTANIIGDWVGTGTHIHINDINFDISGNSASDLLKLAFSVVDRTVTEIPLTDVKILMEFFKNEATTTANYATMQIYVPGAAYNNVQYLNNNKYFVASAEVGQSIDYSNYTATPSPVIGTFSKPYIRFSTSPNFSPAEIRMCRIYAMANVGTSTTPVASTDHYFCFDGFRVDSTVDNPIYKMSGYSVVKADGTPITKLANSNNYIDFRFSLGVS